MRILVSAGEASGDLYAAALVRVLQQRHPEAHFYGCTGPRLRAAGVETVIDAADLAVVGLVEVLAHLPRIHARYRALLRRVDADRPGLAILTDSPDFHLRVARQLDARGIPVAYLVAPQVWAWRKGRLPLLRQVVRQLLCLFPFEQEFFRAHDIPATYIGHPLTRLIRPSATREQFLARHRLDPARPVVVLLPGSRQGETARHLPILSAAVPRILSEHPSTQFILATPPGALARWGKTFFQERIGSSPIQVLDGETWDAIAHSDLALAASGTVTVEAALLGTPMVTFYRVTGLSWLLGRLLVRVPYYTMVNLVAGRRVVPELMQADCTPARLADEVSQLLADAPARERMRGELAEVRRRLATDGDPLERAADVVDELLR